MSGKPNWSQIERVVLISRRLDILRDESASLAARIRADKERREKIESAYGSLADERTKLLIAMDVAPSQNGNFGHEQRFSEFLNMFATCDVRGAAEEPSP